MKNNSQNSPNFLHKRQDKFKHFQAQKQRVFATFRRKTSTMLMVSVETGTEIAKNVTIWLKQGKIFLLKKLLCEVSKHRGGTENTNLFSSPLKLF